MQNHLLVSKPERLKGSRPFHFSLTVLSQLLSPEMALQFRWRLF